MAMAIAVAIDMRLMLSMPSCSSASGYVHQINAKPNVYWDIFL